MAHFKKKKFFRLMLTCTNVFGWKNDLQNFILLKMTLSFRASNEFKL